MFLFLKRAIPLLLLITSLFSCKNDQEKVSIRFACLASPPQERMYKELVSAFEKRYPNIHVELRCFAWESYGRQIDKLFKQNQAPDLFRIQNYYQAIKAGQLKELDAYLKSSDFSWDDFFPQIPSFLSYNRFHYGLFTGLDSLVIFANKEMFEKAKIPFPVTGWSYEEFHSALKKLTSLQNTDHSEQHFGIAFEPTLNRLFPFIWSAGADISSDSRIHFQNPSVVETIRSLSSLALVEKSLPPVSMMMDHGNFELFLEQRTAMIIHGRYLIPELMAKAGFSWDVLPLPVLKKKASLLQGSLFGISSKSRHPDEAWKLLKFMVKEEGREILLSYGDIIPPQISDANSDGFLRWGGNINNRVFLDNITSGSFHPLQKRDDFTNINSKIGSRLWNIFSGSLTVEEGTKAIDEDLKDIIVN